MLDSGERRRDHRFPRPSRRRSVSRFSSISAAACASRIACLPQSLRPITCSRGWSRAATKPRCSRLTAGCTRWPRSRSIRVPYKVRWGRSIRSGPPLCTMQSPRPRSASATRTGRRRAVVVITDGIDTASGLTPCAGVGHRQRDRRAGLHHRHGAADRSPGPRRRARDARSAEPRTARSRTSRRGPAARSSTSSTPADTSNAARQVLEELRAAVRHRVRAGRRQRLAAARDSDAGQGPHRSRAERLHGRQCARGLLTAVVHL